MRKAAFGKRAARGRCGFCLEYIFLTLDKMTEYLLDKYGGSEVLYSGGVMSNGIIRRKMTEKYGGSAIFLRPPFPATMLREYQFSGV